MRGDCCGCSRVKCACLVCADGPDGDIGVTVGVTDVRRYELKECAMGRVWPLVLWRGVVVSVTAVTKTLNSIHNLFIDYFHRHKVPRVQCKKRPRQRNLYPR